MVATPIKTQPRLSIQTAEISPDTTAIRSLDWDRDRFDIEFGLQNGTTYNSYLIRGAKTALVDTSHAKFRQLYLDALQGLIDPKEIDYLIISHTEPDHSPLLGVDAIRRADFSNHLTQHLPIPVGVSRAVRRRRAERRYHDCREIC